MGTDASSTIVDGVTLEGEGPRHPRRALMVYHRDGVSVVPLTDGDPVVIGRAPPSDVVARSRRLSRQHARFELEKEQVWVEDLGSTNGTWLNGQRLSRRESFGQGDEITLGSVSVFVHGLDGTLQRPRGVEGHERFQALLAEELERARTLGRPVTVLMVRSTEGRSRTAGWLQIVQGHLRLLDRIGLYAPDCIEILLPETDERRARELGQVLVRELAPGACCGLATFPDDGAGADRLIEVARADSLRSDDMVEDPLLVAEEETTGPVVKDPAMVQLHRTIDRIARSAISVLVVGETGVGKELVAKAIHDRSDRAPAPMRSLNCGAIPETLLESVLFGHEKGSFTGADQRRSGVFEEAQGGTVFLDEIGELSLSAQVALLRVLETRRIQRVGSSREIPIDVRVLAATHRDLEQMCEEGSFRLDLLYRLNPITLRVPPLRERRLEIRPLVSRFIAESNATNRRSVRGIVPDALALLEGYDWPGNVRELRNTIERAVVITGGHLITVEDLPERLTGQAHEAASAQPTELARTPDLALARATGEQLRLDDLDLKERVQSLEIQLIKGALHACGDNQTQAAELLRIPRRTLVYKIRTYGIEGGDPSVPTPRPVPGPDGRPLDFRERLAALERSLIEEALARSGHDAAAAARLLNVQKRTLLQKIERYDLP